jgi:outer membrane protein insertion porin family
MGNFLPPSLDAGLKSLYATGLFSDVRISHDGGKVSVKVVENPTIFRVAFEGNKKIKDEDLKKLDLQSKANGPLWRAYVQRDVEHMLDLYRERGYFQVRITPKTISQKNARDDLVFEIDEGDKLAVRHVAFAGNNAFSGQQAQGRGQVRRNQSAELSAQQRQLRFRPYRE